MSLIQMYEQEMDNRPVVSDLLKAEKQNREQEKKKKKGKRKYSDLVGFTVQRKK